MSKKGLHGAYAGWVQGMAVLSVSWGAWAGSGMAEKAGIERMERLGFGALQPAAGL